MKKILVTVLVLLSLVAGVYAADELRAGPTGSGVLAQWGPSVNTWFANYASTNTNPNIGATNTWCNLGYTNTTLVKLDCRSGSKVGLGIFAAGMTKATNVCTIRAWPSWDGVNKLTRDGTGAVNPFIATVTLTGATPVRWQTNAVGFGPGGPTTAHATPYMLIQFEQLANLDDTGEVATSGVITNLVIYGQVKP